MSRRKHSPIHDFWHPRVEGQIRDAINSHPEWFRFDSELQKQTMVNSLAKRIVGEIAAESKLAAKRAGVARYCPGTAGSDGGLHLPSDGGEVAGSCVPSESRKPGESATCGCMKCLAERDEHMVFGDFKLPLSATRMIVCSICGNKRCPHATDHRLACTGSNEPGQAGSAYA